METTDGHLFLSSGTIPLGMKKVKGAAAALSKKGLLCWRLSGSTHGVVRCPLLASEINDLFLTAVVELKKCN
jgi:hypothetical protein